MISELNYFRPLRFKVKTLHILSFNFASGRRCVQKSSSAEWLMKCEAELRRSAYKHTPITTGESFYDDSDMSSDYYLVIVYDDKTKTPLLSARYYFNKEMIRFYTAGNADEKTEKQDFVFKIPSAKKVFLA